MEFTIIANEQTPVIDEIDDIKSFLDSNHNKLIAFKYFAETLSNAAGLAANQCAVDGERLMLRAFGLRSVLTGEWSIIIDPIIVEYIGIKEIKGEGCLTWKGQIVVAERNRAVKVKYYDIDGNIHINVFSGFVGQVWQHEINHLNGVPEQIESLNYKLPKSIEVGRNDQCPCGSGKKYKYCCLKLI